ncbi:MAG: glycosyltransferase [Eubacteriales bacterium]|nr:glycosyltransferase [Eubacteriales bacterium]
MNKVKKRLMVIITDRLSTIVKKGEMTERYYNPGNLFDEVHILMLNNDVVDPADVKIMAGTADLFIYNLPAGNEFFVKSFGWQRPLIEGWVNEGIDIAREINPHLIRVYDNFIQGYLAKRIKDELGVNYIISLHGVWDKDGLIGIPRKIMRAFRKKLEITALKDASAVIAVYEPIVRYAKKYGGKNVHLIYNVIAGDKISKKKDYEIKDRLRLITVNRQLKEKNPENIIRAIKDIDCYYLIVGDGEYHDYLIQVARECGCENKVEFSKGIPNSELCSMLKDFDMMVSHCDYWGMSKTIIEAAHAGLPIIINKHPIEPIPEYKGNWILLCDNTPEAYEEAILKLAEDIELRKRYGEAAYDHAMNNYNSNVMEARVVEIYKEFMKE